MDWATIDEFLLRNPSLSSQDEETVEARLGDASAMITAQLDVAGVDHSDSALVVDGEETTLRRSLRMVTCSVVARGLMTAAAMGITQQSQMVGQLQQSFTYANPTGDLYLTRAEREMLGIAATDGVGTQVFYGADVLGGGDGE